MERKLLTLDKDVKEELSFEEVQKRYKKLVSKNINRWRHSYEYEDLEQICLIALWKAYEMYEPEKRIGFGYFANLRIAYALFHHHRAHMRHNVPSISLETEIYNTGSDEKIRIIDVVAGSENLDDIITSIDFNSYLGTLNDIEKTCILYKTNNLTQKEIGKILSKSQVWVSRKISKAAKKLKIA